MLVSGSLRTFDKAWVKNQAILSSLPIEYDVYLHTWEQNIGTYHGVAKGVAPKSFFWRWYPTRFREPEKYYPSDFIAKSINSKILIENFSELKNALPHLNLISSQADSQSFINSSAMYLGMEKVANMASSSEIKYTHFLRIRSDFILHKKFRFKKSDEIVMCGDGVLINGVLISDQCFYAPFDLLPRVMSSFTFLRTKLEVEGWKSEEFGNYRKAEFVLYENLFHDGLLTRIVNVPKRKYGKILREVEIRDDNVKLLEHFRGLLIHNRIVFLKVLIFSFARIFRRLHLTNLIKTILRSK